MWPAQGFGLPPCHYVNFYRNAKNLGAYNTPPLSPRSSGKDSPPLDASLADRSSSLAPTPPLASQTPPLQGPPGDASAASEAPYDPMEGMGFDEAMSEVGFFNSESLVSENFE